MFPHEKKYFHSFYPPSKDIFSKCWKKNDISINFWKYFPQYFFWNNHEVFWFLGGIERNKWTEVDLMDQDIQEQTK